MNASLQKRRVVLVTGLSGGGRSSILRALEDSGYEAVDNPPLPMLEEMVARGERRLAVGVDTRTRGFDAEAVLDALRRLRVNRSFVTELVFAWADEASLLRRYSETRRRHPLAPQGQVTDGIAAEQALTARLRECADLVIDTSALPLAELRRVIEQRFGPTAEAGVQGMVVSLVSFAYAHGLPREADLVFDARFLRNPHYDPILRDRTGFDPEVGAFIKADPDYQRFFTAMAELIELLLPRFVQEGKKYATITIGCTGGRHRSVYLVEQLAAWLASSTASGGRGADPGIDWRLHVTHRELASDAESYTTRPAPHPDGQHHSGAAGPSPVQAQEA